MSVEFSFDNNENVVYLVSPSGGLYPLGVADGGMVGLSTGSGTIQNLGYVAITGDTMTGDLTVSNLFATNISGNLLGTSSGVTFTNPQFNDTIAFTGTSTQLNTIAIDIPNDTGEIVGIPVSERPKMRASVSSGTNILTISGISPWSYYVHNAKYTVSSPISLTGTNTDGLWYAYISEATNTPVLSNAIPYSIDGGDVILFNYIWDASGTQALSLGEERHTAGRDIYAQARFHAGGALLESGFDLTLMNGMDITQSGLNALPDSYLRSQIRVSNGVFWDDDLKISISDSDNPSYNWNLGFQQELGFSEISTTGTSNNLIVFTGTHTLADGRRITAMVGNSTTSIRGSSTISGTTTSTTFNLYSGIAGLTLGDAIVVPARIPVWHMENNQWRSVDSVGFPYLQVGGQLKYNDINTDFLNVTNGHYMCMWLCATNNVNDPIIALMGQEQSSSTNLSTALNEDFADFASSMVLHTIPFAEILPFARLVYEGDTSFTNAARLRDANAINVKITAAGDVGQDHSSLSNRNLANAHPATSVSVDATVFGADDILDSLAIDTQTALQDLSIRAVAKAGDTITGNLEFDTTSSITSVSNGTIDIGTSGNQFGIAYVSGISIDGDRFYPRAFSTPNVIRVSPFAEGTFTNIASAVASISGASATTPYVVLIEPGEYYEPEITVPSWVAIQGREEYSCDVFPTGNNNLFVMSPNSFLSFMEIQNVPSGYSAIVCDNAGERVITHKVSMSNCWNAIRSNCTSGSTYLNLEYTDATADNTNSTQFNFTTSSGATLDVSCENFYVYGGNTNPPIGVLASGTNLTLSLQASALEGSDVTGVGLELMAGAGLTAYTLGASSWGTGISLPQYGSAPHARLYSVGFRNNIMHLDVQHSGTRGYATSYIPYGYYYINENSPFFLAYNDQKIITVAKKGGDFSSIAAACSSISGTSVTNRYVVEIGPGEYFEPQITIPSYTYLRGSTIGSSVIKPSGSWDAIKMSNLCEASFFTVSDVPSGYYAFDFTGCGDYAQLHKISINGNGLKLNTTTGDDKAYIEYVDIEGPYENGVNITSVSGASAFVSLENFFCTQYNSPSGTIDVYVSGPGSEAELKGGTFTGNTSGTAFYVGDEATLNKSSITVKDYEYGLYVDDTGSTPTIGPILNVSNIITTNSTLYDYYIKHAYASGVIAAIAEKELIYVNPLNDTISWNIQDPTGELVLGGDLYLGKQFDQAQYMSPSIANAPAMGVINGGLLSVLPPASGLKVHVAAGYGYLDTDVNDWTKTKYVSWNAQDFSLSANDDVYIYVNYLGAIAKSSTSINGDVSKILLGKAVCNSIFTIWAGNISMEATHWSNKADEYLRDVFGSIVADGLVIAPTGLQLTQTEGEYYFSSHKWEPGPIDPIPSLLEFYHVSGVWTGAVNTSGVVDNSQWDNGVNLTGLTAGYYTKHSIWYQGDANTHMFVFGQVEYSGLEDARLGASPTPPSQLTDAVVNLADIIVQQGSGSIVETIDTRPIPSYKAASTVGGGGITYHNQLLGLNANDHNQYLLTNGTNEMLADLNVNSNNLINVSGINGIKIESHGSRHNPNDLDPLTVANPVAIQLGGSVGGGSASSYNRSDHVHTITQASSSGSGYLSQADWGTFNGKQDAGNYLVSGTTTTTIIPEGTNLYYENSKVDAHLSGTSPITYTSGAIAIPSGSAVNNGYISSGDWSRFDGIANASGNFIQNTGGTINGTLNVSTLSGTLISGGTIYDSANRVITSVNSQSGPSVTLTTANIAEGVNLYYKDERARAALSGTSPIIYSTGTGAIAIQSGSASQNGYISSGDWSTFNSKQAAGNYVVSGTSTTLNVLDLTTLNASTISGTSIYQNGIQVVSSGVGAGNVSVTKTNGTLTISGTQYILPSNVVQSVASSGIGTSLYNSQNGSAVYLNSIAGLGNITISSESNGVVNISGQQYTLPSTVTFTTVNADTVSGTTISGTTIYENGIEVVNSGIGAGTVTVTKSAGTLTISGTQYTLPSTVIQSASSSGTGFGIYNSQNGSNLVFNTISGNGHVTVTSANGLINISGNALTTSDVSEGTNLYYLDSRARAVVSGTSPISVSNALVSIASGSSTQNGYISSGDWNTFNAKVDRTGDTMTGNLTLSGTNLAFFSSGTSSIGTAALPANTIYTDQIYAAEPIYSYIYTNANATANQATQNVYFVASGTYTNLNSSAHFSITTNPHRITYIGANPIWVEVKVFAGSSVGSNSQNCRLTIFKDGTASSPARTDFRAVSTGAPNHASTCLITNAVSGTYFQFGTMNTTAANAVTVVDANLSVKRLI